MAEQGSRNLNDSRDSGRPLSSSLKKRSRDNSQASYRQVSFHDAAEDNEHKNKSVRKIPRQEAPDEFMRQIAKNILAAKKKKQMERRLTSVSKIAKSLNTSGQELEKGSSGNNSAEETPISASKLPPRGPLSKGSGQTPSGTGESNKSQKKAGIGKPPTPKKFAAEDGKFSSQATDGQFNIQNSDIKMIGGKMMKVATRQLPDGTVQKVLVQMIPKG
jgi:hypothetical protein